MLLLALVVGATQGGFRSESGSEHVDIANELRDPMTEDERHGREVDGALVLEHHIDGERAAFGPARLGRDQLPALAQ